MINSINQTSQVNFTARYPINEEGFQKGWDLAACIQSAKLTLGKDGKPAVIKGTGDKVFVILNNDSQYVSGKGGERNIFNAGGDIDKALKAGKTFLFKSWE
jgi:hypothetical protein